MSEEIAATDALLLALARSEAALKAQQAEIARLRAAIEKALLHLPHKGDLAEAVLERALEDRS